MRAFRAIVCFSALAGAAPCQDPVDVFRAGERGYASFRIPAIVRLPDGALLAFAEGRVHGASDAGDIDVVLKRSTDGGRTWGALQVVADNGPGLFGNPAPVVERESGDVVLLLVRQPEGSHERDIRSGKAGHRDPYVMRSTDGGRLWSKPVSIAATCDREDWRWYATGPCHAIQLRQGPHAGRLVAPANFSSSGGGGNEFLGACLLLSDDGGASWRLGAVDESHLGDPAINPNELTVAELASGVLHANARDHGGTSPATRAVAWSEDGGATFTAPFAAEPALVGPVCQGSVLAVPGRAGELLVFSGPSHPQKRERLALRVSRDGGRTWREALVVHEQGAAYSDLVALGDGEVGCLFEADGYARIAFARISSAALE